MTILPRPVSSKRLAPNKIAVCAISRNQSLLALFSHLLGIHNSPLDWNSHPAVDKLSRTLIENPGPSQEQTMSPSSPSPTSPLVFLFASLMTASPAMAQQGTIIHCTDEQNKWHDIYQISGKSLSYWNKSRGNFYDACDANGVFGSGEGKTCQYSVGEYEITLFVKGRYTESSLKIDRSDGSAELFFSGQGAKILLNCKVGQDPRTSTRTF